MCAFGKRRPAKRFHKFSRGIYMRNEYKRGQKSYVLPPTRKQIALGRRNAKMIPRMIRNRVAAYKAAALGRMRNTHYYFPGFMKRVARYI